jgi:tripartite-type tricarboxylate transporter receptor subunit TctC
LCPLAVGKAQRIAALPDVPTVAELGFKDFETSQWCGLLVPVGTLAEFSGFIAKEQKMERDRKASRD